jgi:hypothetical protein
VIVESYVVEWPGRPTYSIDIPIDGSDQRATSFR